jgi:hypothetical protein
MEERKIFKKGLKVFGLFFYVSNIPLKRRPLRWFKDGGFAKDIKDKNKEKLYKRQEGRCAICGEAVEAEKIELHHVLPHCRFPELRFSIRNSVLLCHGCHKEVHMNPFLNIRMMEAKAAELGVDVEGRYRTALESAGTTANINKETNDHRINGQEETRGGIQRGQGAGGVLVQEGDRQGEAFAVQVDTDKVYGSAAV